MTTQTEKNQISLAEIQKDIQYIKEAMQNLNDKLDKDYATKADLRAVDERYRLTKQIVYSAIGLIVTTVFGALVALVVVKP